MPAAFATYAGIKTVTSHADTAKGWISWLNELKETPEEIQSMSAKATTARDTITQVQQTLEARPDLLEGDTGEQLKGQIEDAIASTDKALGKMTKLLSEISKKSADYGNVVNGMQDFWRSYRYKDEFEDKVKKADDELQKEMTGLSTLMVNIYSYVASCISPFDPANKYRRSLMKPAPQGSAPVPSPAPKPEAEKEKEESKEKGKERDEKDKDKEEEAAPHPATTQTASGSSQTVIPTIVEPDSNTKEQSQAPARSKQEAEDRSGKADLDTASPSPPSPSAVANEEAAVGPPPPLSPRDEGKKPDNLPTPPPAASGNKTTRAQSPSREARGSISEQEAQDALLDAAWDGDLDAAARALRHVSHSCCDLRGLTALHLAAERDHLAVAILLLDRGANIQSRSDGGRTPLHLASRSASASMVEMLLERARADPNAQTAKGRTPLHYAASKAEDRDEERREVLRVLRDWGADPTLQDREGETARDVAQKREHWDAAATLRRAERKWEEDHKQNWLQRHGFTK